MGAIVALGRLWRPEGVFLALAVVFGSACLLLTPPCQVPDEAFHFDRAFQLSEGRVIPLKQGNQTGDYLPDSVAHLRQAFERLEKHPEQKTSAAEIHAALGLSIEGDRVFANFPNTGVYPPLAYLPQALGIALARLFSSSVLVCFYAGRVANLLATAVLFFLAIRSAPVGKWAFVVLALTPMALFQTASVSSDALTNATSFLWVAFVLRCACGPIERLAGRDVMILALLVIALGLVKQGYLLLVLAYFLIPAARLGGRGRYWGVFGLLVGCELLAVGSWALVVRNVYSPVLPDIDPQAQWRYLCAHPGAFLLTVVRTATVAAPGTCWEYIGFLGTLDLPLPAWLVLGEGVLLLAVCWSSFPPGAVTGRQALTALGTAVLVYLSVLFVIHLTWDRVGPTDVIDVQGRYFIPLGPLLAVSLGWCSRLVPRVATRLAGWAPALAGAAVPCVLAATTAILYQRYFVDDAQAAAERHFEQGQQLLKQRGQQQQAQGQFEEALRLNPQHAQAHFNLGVLLASSQPRTALAHYREAARLDPNNVQVRNNLANALARQGLFEEAIQHYQEALRIAPHDAVTRQNLQHAQRSQELLHRSLEKIAAVVLECARAVLIDKRDAGTPPEGLGLKPNQGEVLTAAGVPPLPQTRYVWRVPPPSGEPVRVPSEKNHRHEGERRPFYACSTDLVGFRRVFVFPPPLRAVLLADEDVSWFFQVRMDDLTAEEQAREREYRRQQGLRFPLDLRLRQNGQPLP
jgi:uncharacterized membrane protein/cytochrome c-type biogenesis protein CcmH/NrfG